jgi:hypothetical protein
MNGRMAEEALQFGRVVGEALADAGGFDLVRAAETDGNQRARLADLLEELGVWELDARGSSSELDAVASVCRAAGRFALPYPVAERLAAGSGTDGGAVAVVADSSPRINHGDLHLRWRVSDSHGRTAPVVRAGAPLGGKLGRFVCPVEAGLWSQGDDPAALVVTLQAWTVLGMLEHAAEMTYRHVEEREQFGQTLASFQAVQFTLTDVAVATQGLEELAKYTLWSVGTDQPESVTDALALRVASIEAADVVFRICHQMHGAAGFCDETALSWLSRYSQPFRRLPWGRTPSEAELVERLRHAPLAGPFAHPKAMA